MILNMTHYYFFKKLVESIPTHLHDNMEYDNDLLFNLSTFNNVGTFYMLFNPIKIDKYKFDDNLKSNKFNSFIMECLYICKKKNDHMQLLFIYAMVAHNILEQKINDYLVPKIEKKRSYSKMCNMIEFYYAMANDNINLTKINLTKYFPNGFIYHDFMDKLITNPFIKVFGAFCTKQYYTKAYNRKKLYFNFFTRSKTKLKLIPYLLYDLIFNHRGKPKAKNYLYSNKVDTSILNLTNMPYLVGDETFTYSFEDILNQALEEAIEYMEAINSYVINDNPKPIKKLFKITSALMDEKDENEEADDEEFEGLNEEDKKLSKLFKLAKMENEEKKTINDKLDNSNPSEKELKKLEKQKLKEMKKQEIDEESSSEVESNESTPSEKELRKLEKQKLKEMKKLEKQMKKSLDNDDTNQELIELENE